MSKILEHFRKENALRGIKTLACARKQSIVDEEEFAGNRKAIE